MGNQLVGVAPSQIFPAEWYLKDHPELKFESGLGSTRFLKVARAESQEGPVVVKIFAIHDPSLPLQSYKDHLDDIRKKLSSTVNCTPYQKFILTDKAALIVREYVKYSLYDRISTRPFLTDIEKRWITFQILHALHQCHKVGVCHGDIKLENIAVTSWNWVLLVDFASFKPTFLPVDNPGDYSYFFDTSRRRTCYIAPERFFQNRASGENDAIFSENTCDSGDLTPAMDIFSAGCALLELWNELHFPFDYSQILAYKKNVYFPEEHLEKLKDNNLRNLISSMIEIDPAARLSAEDYLDKHKGTLFPEYFYTFLQPYMLIFSANPIMSADEKIIRLHGDIANILKFLGPITKSTSEDSDDIRREIEEEESYEERGESEGLVLMTSLVTSCIRGLHECTSKLFSLEILLELAQHASDETVLDRIVPFIIYLAHDNNPRVKISAINAITKCLDLVQKLPRSDANIFPEYILPELAKLALDQNASVRSAYAKNINSLAEIALRYLDQTQILWHNEDTMIKSDDQHTFNYELELQSLHEMVQQTVSVLLTDTHSIVKQSLVSNGIHKLCVFFGKAKANDIILSHMITFLNDKEDTDLRKSFFINIVGVVSFIGWQCSNILTPLLVQGLTDTSEFVTREAIIAMTALADYSLLDTSSLCELISECCHFLIHPNLWIRQTVCGFIATASKRLSVLDVQCKIIPYIQDFMKYRLIQIDKSELLLESLIPPIPRNVFDQIINYNDMYQILHILEEKKYIRDCLNSGKIPNYDFHKDTSSSLVNLFKRLEAIGMTEQVQENLLKMGHHLKKIHKHKSSADSRVKQNDGKIDIDTINPNIRSRIFQLSDPHKNEYLRGFPRNNTLISIDTHVNSDWNYSSEVLARQTESSTSGAPSSHSTNSRPSSPPPDAHVTQFISTTTDASSLPEKSYIQYRRSTCYLELTKLKMIQQDHYYEALSGKEWAEQAAWKPQLPPPGWHPKGILIAHLHEHRGAVTRLCKLPNPAYFASGSSDGTVKLWDCAQLEGRSIANRSKQNFKLPSGSVVTGLAACDGGHSLAVSCQNGSIRILRLDSASSKMNVHQTKQLDPHTEGTALELQNLDPGIDNVIVYSTLYGDLVAWDLRQPNGVAWRLQNGLRQGLITTFCIDAHQSWLSLGTSDGIHIAWDLRFRLPITTITAPSNSHGIRIRKILPHPTEHSWIISSVQANNEISMWNLETGSRQRVLWGSTTPPLSKMQHENQKVNHSVYAMLTGCIDRSPFLLSGGTDQRLRFWNLESPSESYLAIPAASDAPYTKLTYHSRLIDGTDVIYEETSNIRPDVNSEETPRAGPDPPAPGHRDGISDITLCKSNQCYLVTASTDGIIKIWK